MVDIGIAASDGPEDGGGGAAGSFGGCRKILGANGLAVEIPVGIVVIVGFQGCIGADTVLSGITTSQNGGVGRVGIAGVYGADMGDLCPLFHQSGEIRFRQ